MTNILIVDDYISVCDALTAVFDKTGEFKVAASVSNAYSAVSYCEMFHPDLIFMKVRLEGRISGFSATRMIKAKYSDIKIIIMTGYDEISYIPRAKEAGADGFVHKRSSLELFVETAKKVMNGERYFPESDAALAFIANFPFTKREMEVLRLICANMNNNQISERLSISRNTVKYHKVNMLAKTGFRKISDLAFYMVSNGWINPHF